MRIIKIEIGARKVIGSRDRRANLLGNGPGLLLLATTLPILLLGACDDAEEAVLGSKKNDKLVAVADSPTQPNSGENGAGSELPLVPLSDSKICKAAIAKIMQRDPNIIRANEAENAEIHLDYRRPNDGSLWQYKCKVVGETIYWGNREGRWRDHPADGKLSYSVSGDSVIIDERFGDGSTSAKTYQAHRL